jgi:hypothetical protein
VSEECEWRYEEMMLVTYTPMECVNLEIAGCENLVAYARFSKRMEKK